MPEQRLERTRPSLPVGYQFGDAKWTPTQVIAAKTIDAWHAERRIAMMVSERISAARNP